jgi:hypothetical protein
MKPAIGWVGPSGTLVSRLRSGFSAKGVENISDCATEPRRPFGLSKVHLTRPSRQYASRIFVIVGLQHYHPNRAAFSLVGDLQL